MLGGLAKFPARRARLSKMTIVSFHSQAFPPWSKVPFGPADPV
jgi:hypothetical protein